MMLKIKKSNFFSKDGHLNDLGIALCSDSLLYHKENELPDELKSHITDCLVCKHKIVDVFEFLSEEILTKEHPYFSNLHKKNRFNTVNIFKIAASILVVVSLGITGLYFINNNKQLLQNKNVSELQEDSSLIKPNESDLINTDNFESNLDSIEIEEIINVQKQQLIAKASIEDERYILSDNQQAMIGNVMRSDYFEVISPKDSTSFKRGEEISFSWKTDVEDEIILKIFNNKAELTFESESIINNTYLLKDEFERGAYIWKVETDNDVLYIGVFYIK